MLEVEVEVVVTVSRMMRKRKTLAIIQKRQMLMSKAVMRRKATYRTMTARVVTTATVVAAMTRMEEPSDVIKVMVVVVEILELTKMGIEIPPRVEVEALRMVTRQ